MKIITATINDIKKSSSQEEYMITFDTYSKLFSGHANIKKNDNESEDAFTKRQEDFIGHRLVERIQKEKFIHIDIFNEASSKSKNETGVMLLPETCFNTVLFPPMSINQYKENYGSYMPYGLFAIFHNKIALERKQTEASPLDNHKSAGQLSNFNIKKSKISSQFIEAELKKEDLC